MAKMTFRDERQRDRWSVAMRMDMMSSEESDLEGDDVICVKSLPWRSNQLCQLIKQLDQKIDSERSPQARQQLKARVFSGEPSSRPKPVAEDDSLPSWLFN